MWKGRWLLDLPVADAPTQVGIYAHKAAAAFEMVRVVAIGGTITNEK
jgi:hypothetical protein